MLAISSVTQRFGSITALDNVSLSLEPGEFFGLLGPNGAGKSTLMSLIAGLRAPQAGRIVFDGNAIAPSLPDSRSSIGLAPQSIALYPDLTAEQNLHIFGELHGLRGPILGARIDDALRIAQLSDRRHHAVKSFSGGMKRRLNLVAALLHQPKLLLCDEPTVGVDPQSRNAIFETIEELNRAGLSVIYSTHYMEEAERLCSRIGIIDHGRILALGSLDELLTKLPFEDEIRFPATAATAPLLPRITALGRLTTEGASHLFRPPPGFCLSEFFRHTEELGLPARWFVSQRPSLEALFLHLTGRTLRE